jgi:hypothetical protein
MSESFDSEFDYELHEITETEAASVHREAEAFTRQAIATAIVLREKPFDFGVYQRLGRKLLGLHIATSKYAAEKFFGIDPTGLN